MLSNLCVCFSKKHKIKTKSICDAGFTLVELMVTMGILVVISLGLLINYPQFRNDLALKRTAQEIALSIRQAQVYGLSIREFGGNFPTGYGVHFDDSLPDSFVLFADIDDGQDYDVGDGCGGSNTECVELFTIQTSDRISDLCGNKVTLPEDCGLSQLDIIYKRPVPEVFLKSGASSFSDAEIIVTSLKGEEKTIVVWSTGQIAVE